MNAKFIYIRKKFWNRTNQPIAQNTQVKLRKNASYEIVCHIERFLKNLTHKEKSKKERNLKKNL